MPGAIASLGVFAYAIGKFPRGWLADFLGGGRTSLAVITLLSGVAAGVYFNHYRAYCYVARHRLASTLAVLRRNIPS
jgi:hypothetical protein